MAAFVESNDTGELESSEDDKQQKAAEHVQEAADSNIVRVQDEQISDEIKGSDIDACTFEDAESLCKQSEIVGSVINTDATEFVSYKKTSTTNEDVTVSCEQAEVSDKNVRETSSGDKSVASKKETSTETVKQSVDVERSTCDGPDNTQVTEPLDKQNDSSSDASLVKPVLETLTFNVARNGEDGKDVERDDHQDVCVCLLCDRSYPSYDQEDILAHLVLMHKFVIADVNFIGDFAAYMKYWKKRFEEKPFAEFCSKIVTNAGVKDDADKEEFYLLCDALPDDKKIREDLQRKKLESVLLQQQKEREETKFCRRCLFCSQTYCGNRSVLIEHLLKDHTFHLGQADNLVFTDELFDLIESKLERLLCLFCEKPFKDPASQKEHMRKKQHRKINPKCKEFDRFYIVNYMEMGKNWHNLHSGSERPTRTSEKESDEEDEWAGWNAESELKVICLFCDVSCVTVADLQQHMKERHSFDQEEMHKNLNFYQKVKLVNYIRRQVYEKTCYGCQQVFASRDELLAHLDDFSDHVSKIPDMEVWDQSKYCRPTYEDDSLLCYLDDGDENDDIQQDDHESRDNLGVTIIEEDIPVNVTDTVLNNKKLYRTLLKT